MRALSVAVIIGSTREGRVGGAVGDWFTAVAKERDDIEITVLDLIDFDLPYRYPEFPTPAMAAFAAEVGRADAFVVVAPEYNRGVPGSLKQAIDCAYDEWRAKAVGFVVYGSGSDGVYAAEHLRCVFTELHTVTMRNSVRIDLLRTGAEGDPRAASALLDQLVWWGLALRDARLVRPYVS